MNTGKPLDCLKLAAPGIDCLILCETLDDTKSAFRIEPEPIMLPFREPMCLSSSPGDGSQRAWLTTVERVDVTCSTADEAGLLGLFVSKYSASHLTGSSGLASQSEASALVRIGLNSSPC